MILSAMTGSSPSAIDPMPVPSPRMAFNLTPLTPLSADRESLKHGAKAERGDKDPRRQGAAEPPLASLGNLPSPGEASSRRRPRKGA